MKVGRRDVLRGAAAAAVLASCASTPVGSQRRQRSLGARNVEAIVPGLHTRDGAGVSLVRQLGQPALRHLDPFVLLDQIQSSVPDDYVRGFPSHPHRGFETVTVMLEGAMRHRDSRGNHGLITGGGAQWMTAGSGIVHSEMPVAGGGTRRPRPAGEAVGAPPPREGSQDGELFGFQLWVNLPRAEKWRTPEYQDLAPERLAEATLDGGGVLRVIAGETLGVRGPVRDRATAPLLVTLRLSAREELELRVPRDHAALALVAEGEAEVGASRDLVREDDLAVLSPRGELVWMRAGERGARVLFVAGQPLGEPIVQRGPFVMNTEAEIEQAWADYRAGTLG